ncbi:hypothetical protein ACMD2_09860 [Ananas comosus]|uniref:Uncharacterized protein n=1 Tax=Ananas comosus TaxID=4615 RepID=A0A199UMZ4_ANACO|nr:hypothetical protein ACMD2_09860 [Ananas comosus]
MSLLRLYWPDMETSGAVYPEFSSDAYRSHFSRGGLRLIGAAGGNAELSSMETLCPHHLYQNFHHHHFPRRLMGCYHYWSSDPGLLFDPAEEAYMVEVEAQGQSSRNYHRLGSSLQSIQTRQGAEALREVTGERIKGEVPAA